VLRYPVAALRPVSSAPPASPSATQKPASTAPVAPAAALPAPRRDRIPLGAVAAILIAAVITFGVVLARRKRR
jgi:hypothetical protein